jgi:hydroxymethylglutaryl-CoA reductase
MMVVELLIDVQEAMGANIVNTVCEGVSFMVQ